MADSKALILEGSNGVSFFLKETLIDDGLVDHVDLVSQADQAITLINQGTFYQLIVINLFEAPEEGAQLGFWLSQQSVSYPVILLMSPEELSSVAVLQSRFPCIILPVTTSLMNFSQSARLALA